MSFTLTTSGALVLKAGANASQAATLSGSFLQGVCDEAEGEIITETRRDWITSYSALPDGVKKILSKTTSALGAMMIINYDMSGYTSRTEAQTMLDVLKDSASKNMQILKDFNIPDIKTP